MTDLLAICFVGHVADMMFLLYVVNVGWNSDRIADEPVQYIRAPLYPLVDLLKACQKRSRKIGQPGLARHDHNHCCFSQPLSFFARSDAISHIAYFRRRTQSGSACTPGTDMGEKGPPVWKIQIALMDGSNIL